MRDAYVPPLPSRTMSAMFMLCASAGIAISTLCAKYARTDTLGEPLHALQVTQGRFGFALLGLLAAAAILRPVLRRPHWRLHLMRTSLGGVGVTLMFAAVAFIPLSDATAISFLNPVFAMLLAIPLLGERVGHWRWAAAMIALIGAVILLRPGAGSLEIGALLALGAAVVLGTEIILVKRLSGLEPPLALILVNNAIGFALFGTIGMLVWQAPTNGQWLALAGTGLTMGIAQICFVASLARAEASFAVPFSYATLVFAAFYDAVLFRVVPDAASIAGALTILAGAAILAWREARLSH